MRTTLLYHLDDHRTSFEATVLSIDREQRTVVLDATAFYPTGGHQHCDQGRIGKDRRNFVVVTDVEMLPSGAVLHRWAAGEGTLAVGDRVEGSVHAARRLHHMQLHTAQHAFSRLAENRFGSRTGRADFAPGGGLVVIEPALEWEQALLLEDDLNRLVREDVPVTRRLDEEDHIRIAIGDLDESRCGGTHVTSTGEIGLFKLVGLDGKVVRYETGHAAARHAVRMGGHALEAARRLGLERTAELPAAVEALIREREQAEEKLERWKQEITERQLAQARRSAVQRSDGVLILFVDLSHLKAQHAREMIKRDLASVGEVWICLGQRGNVFVASGSERMSARETVEQIGRHWNMRAGGNVRFAQGGPVPDEVGSPLEQIAERLVPASERSLS